MPPPPPPASGLDAGAKVDVVPAAVDPPAPWVAVPPNSPDPRPRATATAVVGPAVLGPVDPPPPSGRTAPAPAAPSSPPPRASGRRPFRPIDLWRRYLPPVRLVWIFLGVLVAYGDGFVSAARAVPLLALPITAAIVDLGFQRARFPRLRFPDSALAIGLFLALIVWPSDFSLALAAVTITTVAIRHVVRSGGHPWLNPTGAGVALGFFLFSVPTSWHVGVSVPETVLVAVLGAVLVARAPHTWRFPVFFFATYVPLVMALAFALGAGAHWSMLLTTEALGPQAVFFGMFMASEPRTAPSARWAMVVYSVIVGASFAVLPVVIGLSPMVGGLGVISPFLALFCGNFFTIALPSGRGARAPSPRSAPPRAPSVGRSAASSRTVTTSASASVTGIGPRAPSPAPLMR